jgi:hypothetical protein
MSLIGVVSCLSDVCAKCLTVCRETQLGELATAGAIDMLMSIVATNADFVEVDLDWGYGVDHRISARTAS